jgi:predicted alpha/beta-fold hydrolase
MAKVAGDMANYEIYLRKDLLMNDGEEIALDIFPRDLTLVPEDRPTVIFLTGINGDSKCNYAKILSEKVYKQLGWRTVIQNKRGFGSKAFKANALISWSKY